MNRAIVNAGDSKVELIQTPIPTPGEGQILVRVVAVAHQPLDWDTIFKWPQENYRGNILGCDYSGHVESLGPGVTKYSKGDRVAGCALGNVTKSGGVFAEYAVADAVLSFPVPENMSLEDAATLGTPWISDCLCLYKYLEAPWPYEKPLENTFLLVHGGSTTCGTLLIQLARLSGLRILATASLHNFDLVKSMGAEMVFDRNHPEASKQIFDYTKGSLKLAVNFSEEFPSSLAFIEECIGTAGGKAVNLQYTDTSTCRSDIEWGFFIAFEAFVGSFSLAGFEFRGTADGRELVAKAWNMLPALINDKKIKTHPVRIVPNGLLGIHEVFDSMNTKGISGQRCVSLIGQ